MFFTVNIFTYVYGGWSPLCAPGGPGLHVSITCTCLVVFSHWKRLVFVGLVNFIVPFFRSNI